MCKTRSRSSRSALLLTVLCEHECVEKKLNQFLRDRQKSNQTTLLILIRFAKEAEYDQWHIQLNVHYF
jgi:hypothetical protein